MYPNVKLLVSAKEDAKTAYDFLGYSAAGIDFSKNITKMLPALESVDKSSKSGKKIIGKEVSAYHEEHEQELKRKQGRMRKRWDEIQDRFFKETGNVFKGWPWPKGKYIGYVSIFDCNPRNPSNKTFQMWVGKKDDDFLGGIAHELLHFMFYNYSTP